MAAGQPSFQDFINAEREKKRKEKLANEILGRGRKTNASGPGAIANTRNSSVPRGPSLASRMGVQKRSSSAKPGDINGQWKHDLHRFNNPRGGRPTQLPRTASANSAAVAARTSLSYDLIRRNNDRAFTQNNTNDNTVGFNIKGMGGNNQFTVIASNFSPGTTAEDIEAVMAPVGTGLVSCRLVSEIPTVIVEMLFTDKEGAENVIATFNNKKADGRLLYVYMKEPVQVRKPPTQPRGRFTQPAPKPAQDGMDVDMMDDRKQQSGRLNNGYNAGNGGYNPALQPAINPPKGPRRDRRNWDAPDEGGYRHDRY
ncbi:hypothetical protein GQ43DRAFT_437437 [Delitschia confertaspora ATCC 74209]|uniref:RRM domain-containing protein n=1 Tax=Delitschia confertaspora ATCC 74209 TaxID=1513339 RepID=A0A9P4JTG4_9PLEO|nr:hypothetical protein GQ43DRAFT_437437 [Delitschia confertaspora ATCC 74209]